ncbi:MAG TPA: hypothetical protein PLQ44_03105, partial [Candidatus Paceibacterota bacterium]|nr:hypothetical protein [Candidatus Paceibacterota bacterium]
MNTNHYSSKTTLRSHTHLQAAQADTQAEACKRVCLPNAENKNLKISFPSKNFKNAIAQSDTLALRQLVANLNIDNGCVTRTTRTPACNTGLAKVAVQCFYDSFVGKQTVVHLINICGENRHLRQARKR